MIKVYCTRDPFRRSAGVQKNMGLKYPRGDRVLVSPSASRYICLIKSEQKQWHTHKKSLPRGSQAPVALVIKLFCKSVNDFQNNHNFGIKNGEISNRNMHV